MEIQYFEIAEMPGKQMFRCEKMRASISVNACSLMWREAAEKGAPERLDRCRNCQIGAKHAGVGDASLSPLRGSMICGRCEQGATRLIHGHLCVSCYNRQREYLLGRNAKGNAPKCHPQLHALAIKYRAGQVVKVMAMPHVVHVSELVIAALRDEPKQVTFGPMIKRPAGPQAELFA